MTMMFFVEGSDFGPRNCSIKRQCTGTDSAVYGQAQCLVDKLSMIVVPVDTTVQYYFCFLKIMFCRLLVRLLAKNTAV
jgi:hypothetical protein